MKNESSYEKGSSNTQNAQAIYRNVCEGVQGLSGELKAYEQQLLRLNEHIYRVCMEADCLRRQYDEVVSERKYIDQAVVKAEEELQQVRKIIERYTSVEDAVVASDGYTYERRTIEEYIQNCINSSVQPRSQQTDQELQTIFYPNRSLKTLLDRLVESSDANYSSKGHADPNHKPSDKEAIVEFNAKGERVHPCIRVYGFCNYSSGCAYAYYPYEACLSNLKGKCRFRNQCHERHVDFRGPLNANGEPLNQAEGAAATPASSNKEKAEESS